MGKVFKVCEEDEWEGAKNNEFFVSMGEDNLFEILKEIIIISVNEKD